ncbi:MAG: 1,4-alpha-glucan branching enzyme, partial [Acidocella sp.]|nr:1,4-alpha-glucan branching enzyme [Acidocella sp.]
MSDPGIATTDLLSDYDLYLIGEGRHRDLATSLGAQCVTVDGQPGVRFALWAPNARRVAVVGNFNNWNGEHHSMRARSAGIWEIFISHMSAGDIYKYEVTGPNGLLPLRADPMARQAEIPPATGSIVAAQAAAIKPPLRRTQPPGLDKPLSIYEVHAASWMRHFNGT